VNGGATLEDRSDVYLDLKLYDSITLLHEALHSFRNLNDDLLAVSLGLPWGENSSTDISNA
jgi:hypothetical protein